jgi:hypothetical protein
VPFENPVVGGTALRIPAIQSPDFQTGVSGWIIRIDGSAEFNNLTVRGEFVGQNFIIDSHGIFLYSGTPANGNLIGSWASVAGTDQFGNAYAAGITLYSVNGTINLNDVAATWNADPSGAGIQISVGGGSVTEQFSPAVVSGITWNNGAVGAALASRLGTNTPQTFLTSPTNSLTPGATSSLSLYGGPQTSIDVLSEAVVSAVRMWANVTTGWITGAWSKLSETWHTPTFAANWATTGTLNGNATFRGMQYRQDAEDNVWILGGAVASGAGASVFTLPAGYRPPTNNRCLIPAWIFDSSAATETAVQVQVTEAGVVNAATSLTGITIAAGDQIWINGKFPLGNI